MEYIYIYISLHRRLKVFPDGASGEESACLPMQETKRYGFDPWVGNVPWNNNVYLLQCSCLGNPMERGVWQATVHGVTESKRLGHDWVTKHTNNNTSAYECQIIQNNYTNRCVYQITEINFQFRDFISFFCCCYPLIQNKAQMLTDIQKVMLEKVNE